MREARSLAIRTSQGLLSSFACLEIMELDQISQDSQNIAETVSSDSTSATLAAVQPISHEKPKCSDATAFAYDELSFNVSPKPEKKSIVTLLKELGGSIASLKKSLAPRLAGLLQRMGRLNVPLKYNNHVKDLMGSPEIAEACDLIAACGDPPYFNSVVTASSAWGLQLECQFSSPCTEYWKQTFSCEVLRKSFFLMLLAILKSDDRDFVKHVKLCRTVLLHEELTKARFAVWDFFINLVPSGAEEEIKHLRDRIPNT